jgi:hypothetical protein
MPLCWAAAAAAAAYDLDNTKRNLNARAPALSHYSPSVVLLEKNRSSRLLFSLFSFSFFIYSSTTSIEDRAQVCSCLSLLLLLFNKIKIKKSSI